MKERQINYYEEIHKEDPDYGNTSVKNLRLIMPNIIMLKPQSIVDYGCGKGNLLDEVGKKLSLKKTTKYDPAIPLFSREIEGSHDLLINIDVLEHVPENEIDDLLLKMKKVADNYLFIIDLAPADLILQDGSNAHCTLKTKDWWSNKLESHFGKMYSHPTLRSTRAGFKSWKVANNPINALKYFILRGYFLIRYYYFRIFFNRKNI
jgi:hypothetical protein|tara:strand:+ start:66 stop:683 length:618 start_codon:yes stop_codon:yes gene_type:complete